MSFIYASFVSAEDTAKITIRLDGHVKKAGNYLVDKRVKQNLDELIQMAGGFDPLEEFKDEKTSSVAWIERHSQDTMEQLIIIDYQNKQILSQRRIDDKKWRLERYDWDTFEYLPDDVLFITTSRKSLDLANVPIRYVEDDGWTGFEKLRYFGKTEEETRAIDEAKSKAK
ncbi:MAG: hypothetical protein NZM04_04050 [Methylacidiphilales bacterium]|nr:hypothetical protein [Candidatus Methylacidiphilales bacterium]